MNKNLLEEILKKLKKKGCDQADVIFAEDSTSSASSRLGKIEKTEVSEIREIGIRAIIKKKQSIISSTNLESDNINKLIDKVVEMAKVVPEDEFCGLAEEKYYENINKKNSELQLFDSYKPKIKELNEKVLELENSALENKQIINSEGAELSFSSVKYHLMASNGFQTEINKTHSDYIVAVLAGNKNSMERAYDYKSKVFFDDLGNFKKIGKKVSVDAIKKLNSRKIKTCKSDVIFDSRVSSSLLSNLFNACNASAIIKGTSFLKNHKEKKVFNSKINVIDDPHMKKRLRSKFFDAEGLTTKKQNLIENGTLKFFFNCLSTARQLKDTPSRHGSRSISSIPSASYSNLYLDNGDNKKKDMIKSMKKGLLVTELMGSSINYANGDYSRGASGFWIENGEISYPVSEITIAGNLKNIFSNLSAADDLEFNFGINAPSIFVENLTLGGI